MAEQRFQLVADVSSDKPAVIESLVRQLVQGQITKTPDGFHIEASMTGASARDLNLWVPRIRSRCDVILVDETAE
jgi:hypothetical protein